MKGFNFDNYNKFKSKLKKIITVSLIGTTLIMGSAGYSLPTFGDYQVIYTDTSSENLSTGVTYNEKLMFTDIGWISVKYMVVDLADDNTSVDVLFNKDDVTVRKKLSTLSEVPNLVGSINGDFFDYDAKSTLGTIVSEGNFISTGIHDGKFSSFNISKAGIPFLQNWTSAGLSLQSETSKLNIEYKNKPYLDWDRAIIYDSSWKDKSYGNTLGKDVIEMVVKDDMIIDIRKNMDPVTISDGVSVISAVGTKIPLVEKGFKIGDTVKVNYDINFNNIATSIGGGSIILDKGETVKNLSMPVPGRHPRTAIGINKDRNKLIYCIVEGRTASYTGVTESELAAIMKTLGAYEALNLDGGGSSEMILKYPGLNTSKMVNTPTDGRERPIYTGLGIFSTAPISDIASLEVTIPDYSLVGAKLKIDPMSIDKNYNRKKVDPKDIQMEFNSEEFKLVDNYLVPLKEGDFKITFSYNDITTIKEIEVIDGVVDLSINKTRLVGDVNSKMTFDVKAVDKYGYKHDIDKSKLMYTLSSQDIGSIQEDGSFMSSNNKGQAILRISYDTIEKYIPVVVGNNYKVITDFEPDEAIAKELKLSTYPEKDKGNFVITGGGYNNTYGGLLEYDFSYSDATRAAYLSIGENGKVLDDTTVKLGVTVYGNGGNDHWLRANLKDGDGNSVNIDFTTDLVWDGWKTVEAEIPSTLKKPLTLQKVYLVETEKEKKDSGKIILDHLVEICSPTITVDVPKDKTKIFDINTSIVDKLSDRFINITGNQRDLTKYGDKGINILLGNTDTKSDGFTMVSYPNKYEVKDIKDIKFVNMVNYDKSIRKSGYGQWMNLLKLNDNLDSKGLIVILSSGKDFKDPLEEKLFYDTLNDIKKTHNIPVMVVYPNSSAKYQLVRSVEVLGIEKKTSKEAKKDVLPYLTIGINKNNSSFKLVN